jgi:hypothetical protein
VITDLTCAMVPRRAADRCTHPSSKHVRHPFPIHNADIGIFPHLLI